MKDLKDILEDNFSNWNDCTIYTPENISKILKEWNENIAKILDLDNDIYGNTVRRYTEAQMFKAKEYIKS